MNTRRRLEELQAQENIALRRAAEIARLEEKLAARPEQPPVDAVIAFEHVYPNSPKAYNFVAYQAVEGWWYISQSNYRGGMPRMKWDDLLDFVGDEEIYICAGWEVLA